MSYSIKITKKLCQYYFDILKQHPLNYVEFFHPNEDFNSRTKITIKTEFGRVLTNIDPRIYSTQFRHILVRDEKTETFTTVKFYLGIEYTDLKDFPFYKYKKYDLFHCRRKRKIINLI